MADPNDARDTDSPGKPAGDRPTGGEQPDPAPPKDRPVEIGGRKGPDPTRYGDWEKGGRCIDF